MNPIRVLVVDDEPSAREGLRVLLDRRDDVDMVGEAGDVDQARSALETLNPDVVLLDVRMPGGTGLDAVREVSSPLPVVVLITAHPEHALEAFDVQAVDYLLKPFSDADFDRAIRRASRQVRRIRTENVSEHLAALMAETSATSVPAGGERIPVRRGDRVTLVPLDDIRWVEAEGDYVRLHTDEGDYLHRATMQSMADRLGDRFVRIHRSTLVRFDHIREIRPRGRGRYLAIFHDGRRRNISPQRYPGLQDRLGI